MAGTTISGSTATKIDTTPDVAPNVGGLGITSGLAANLGAAGSIAASAGGAALLGGTVSGAMDTGAMSAEAIMAKANDVQNKLAMASAANQVAGLVRSMMMQVLRDFIKDAKDTVKDQGEAGHKP